MKKLIFLFSFLLALIPFQTNANYLVSTWTTVWLYQNWVFSPIIWFSTSWKSLLQFSFDEVTNKWYITYSVQYSGQFYRGFVYDIETATTIPITPRQW